MNHEPYLILNEATYSAYKSEEIVSEYYESRITGEE